MEHADKLPRCALIWCALCRLAFFATGSAPHVRERAAACGWVRQGGRHWCDECAKPYRGYVPPAARVGRPGSRPRARDSRP